MLPVGRKPVDSKACEASCYATMADVQQVRQSMLVPPMLAIQKLGDPGGSSCDIIYTKDLAAVGVLPDGAAHTFDESQICCPSFPHTYQGPSIFLEVLMCKTLLVFI